MKAFLQRGTVVRFGGQPDDTGGLILVAVGPADGNTGAKDHPSFVWTFLTATGTTLNLPAGDVQATSQPSPWAFSLSRPDSC